MRRLQTPKVLEEEQGKVSVTKTARSQSGQFISSDLLAVPVEVPGGVVGQLFDHGN